MKTTLTLLGAVLLGFAGAACAQTTSGLQDMQMGQHTHGMQLQQAAQSTGVVKVIDTAKGTATIQHQAIASTRWPTMAMTFKAEPPSVLQTVKVGEKVSHPAPGRCEQRGDNNFARKLK